MHTFVKWEEIIVKGNESGVKKTTCPNCSHTRKKKKDPCLYVNFKSGVAKCYNCEALSFRDSDSKEIKEDNYKLPNQEWKNHTELSDNLVKYIESTRAINQNTLKALGVTEEEYYQPAIQKKTNNIVFNYFERDILVNKKYRDAKKNFTQSAGTKNIFYNINSIIGKEECWIVEGEFDVLALHQIGIKNCVSVPNGANDNDDHWKNSETYFKDVKRFIIAVDKDNKGKELKDRVAQRLGRYRCEFIDWKGKDANDDLISGDLRESVKHRKKFPVSGTFKVSDLKEGILNLYENGLPETMSPSGYFFEGFNDVFSLMPGQLTTGTGIPSHGKSNFTDWMVLNLINEYDLKASWFSPEHSPMELYQTNLMEKVIGKNFWKSVDGVPRISKEDIQKYEDWANEKIYLTGAEGDTLPTWDWLLEKFKEQMYNYGINIFVVDAFNKVLLPQGNKLEQINIVLTKLTHFAQSNNVSIILVAHPKKMEKNQETGLYGIPTLYDVSGSADFRNQTHNGFTIYRNWENEEADIEEGTDFYNMKTKFNFQGEIGEKVSFNYCKVNGRYYVKGSEAPCFSLIDYNPKEKQQEIFETKKQEIQVATASQAFDVDDLDSEVPF